MDENKKLLDEELSNVAGGKVLDNAWYIIEKDIKILKDYNVPNGKEIMLSMVRSAWEEGYTNIGYAWTHYSTDKSQEDLDALIAFIEEKWEEQY